MTSEPHTPRPPEHPPECGPCLVLHKFHDLDADGVRDFNELPLADIPFDFVAEGQTHHRVTDSAGDIRICFPRATLVEIHELPHQTGGVWRLTTPLTAVQLAGCAETHLSVGNARVQVPATGRGGR